jgi:hypothetical protein
MDQATQLTLSADLGDGPCRLPVRATVHIRCRDQFQPEIALNDLAASALESSERPQPSSG